MESVQDGNQSTERTIQQNIGNQTDLIEEFPNFCSQLGIAVESIDDYCLCIRDRNLPVCKLETLRKLKIAVGFRA